MEKCNHCFLYICFMVWQMVYLSVCLTFFLCSCSYCILSYVYKTLKMPAHWCIYELIFYIYLIKYLFNISEYKAMLIKLLIYHINIDVCIYMYIYIQYMCVRVCVCVYTGAGHIIRMSSKSWFISLIPFKKWNLYNVYIHSTQTDIFQVFIYFNF